MYVYIIIACDVCESYLISWIGPDTGSTGESADSKKLTTAGMIVFWVNNMIYVIG